MRGDRGSVWKSTLRRTAVLTLVLGLAAAGTEAQGKKAGNPEK